MVYVLDIKVSKCHNHVVRNEFSNQCFIICSTLNFDIVLVEHEITYYLSLLNSQGACEIDGLLLKRGSVRFFLTSRMWGACYLNAAFCVQNSSTLAISLYLLGMVMQLICWAM